MHRKGNDAAETANIKRAAAVSRSDAKREMMHTHPRLTSASPADVWLAQLQKRAHSIQPNKRRPNDTYRGDSLHCRAPDPTTALPVAVLLLRVIISSSWSGSSWSDPTE